MTADSKQNVPMAFAELVRDSLLQALAAHCGTAWQPGANPEPDQSGSDTDGFHAIFTFEGSLNGDLHLRLNTDDALALASALLGQASASMGDSERDAIVEFLDAMLPALCDSAKSLHGVFTASLTVTSSPSPEGLESYNFRLADAKGIELTLQILVALDLAASLDEQVLAREQTEAKEQAAAKAEAIADEAAEDRPAMEQTEDLQPEPARPVFATAARSLPHAPQSDLVESVNLELVLDVELNVSLRFGKRQLTLREILELTSGSVIELDRQVEEPVELLLDGRVIARGEAVVIDGNYGLRVTEVPQQFTTTMLR